MTDGPTLAELLGQLLEMLTRGTPEEEVLDFIAENTRLVSQEAEAELGRLSREARQAGLRPQARLYRKLRRLLVELRPAIPPLMAQIDEVKAVEAGYRSAGDVACLDAAAAGWERILASADFDAATFEQRAGILNDSSNTLIRRHYETRSLADLDVAAQRFRRLIEIAPEDSEFAVLALSSLSEVYRLRHDVSQDIADADVAVGYGRQAVTHSGSAHLRGSRINLANALLARYPHAPAPELLEEAIGLVRANLTSISRSPADKEPADLWALSSCALGNALMLLFEQRGCRAQIDEAIAAFQAAAGRYRPPSYQYETIARDLAKALRIRGERFGLADDLTAATLELKHYEHSPASRLATMTALDDAYLHIERYKTFGGGDELQAAAGVLRSVAGRTQNREDLGILSNAIGVCERFLFDETGDVGHLAIGVDSFEAAIMALPGRAGMMAIPLVNLAGAYVSWFQHTNDEAYLRAALDAVDSAGRMGAAQRADCRGVYLAARAACCLLAWEASPGNPDCLAAAMQAARAAATPTWECPAADTFAAAWNWLTWAFRNGHWEAVEESHAVLKRELSVLLGQNLLESSREAWLRKAPGMSSMAAFALVAQGRLDEAATILEGSQARLLRRGYALDLQLLKELDTIGQPGLHEEFVSANTSLADCRRRLEAAESRGVLAPGLQPSADVAAATAAFASAAATLDGVAARIRDTPGFEDFLQEIPASQVPSWPSPVVYVAATPKGGFALRAVNGTVSTRLDLPDLTSAYVEAAARRILAKSRGEIDDPTWRAKLDSLCESLWDAVSGVLAEKLPDKSITVVPVGLLALLPLHAAWAKRSGSGREYALDRMEITYAPNIGTLLAAERRRSRSAPHQPRRFLGIAGALPHAAAEARAIASSFDTPTILDKQEATAVSILDQLPRHDVIHFACHGHADAGHPLRSCLRLADGEELTLDDVLRVAPQTLDLVTIAACESGSAGTDLPEEFLSLGTGFMTRHAATVVSALWAVEPVSTWLLMRRLYVELRTAPSPGAALRRAQQWVRDTSTAEKLRFLDDPPGTMHGRYQEDADTAGLADAIRSAGERLDFSHPHYWGGYACLGS